TLPPPISPPLPYTTLFRSIVGHVRYANHLAVPLGCLDVDDADAAARLQAVFVDLGPLPVALLGDGQDRAAGRQHLHRDGRIAFRSEEHTSELRHVSISYAA